MKYLRRYRSSIGVIVAVSAMLTIFCDLHFHKLETTPLQTTTSLVALSILFILQLISPEEKSESIESRYWDRSHCPECEEEANEKMRGSARGQFQYMGEETCAPCEKEVIMFESDTEIRDGFKRSSTLFNDEEEFPEYNDLQKSEMKKQKKVPNDGGLILDPYAAPGTINGLPPAPEAVTEIGLVPKCHQQLYNALNTFASESPKTREQIEAFACKYGRKFEIEDYGDNRSYHINVIIGDGWPDVRVPTKGFYQFAR